MFPLAGEAFPATSEQLAAAIAGTLSEVFTSVGDRTVRVTSGTFPALRAIEINVDGAAVIAAKPPPGPKGIAKREPGVTVERLDVSGQPIRYGQASLNLKLSGRGLSFDFARDNTGRPLLLLADAASGDVQANITKQDLRTLLLAAAVAGAKEHGITIQDLQIDLSADGPRSVAATVRVRAKKLIMTGAIVMSGRIDVDDELYATASRLTCTGEGVVGALAANLVRKAIQPYDGAKIPLMTFSLGDVKLRDLKITVTDALRVRAAFGKKS